MKINKQEYVQSKDFNVVEICKMLAENDFRSSNDGSLVSFFSPVTLTVTDENDVKCKNALNIVYIIPKCTPEELAAFQFLFSTRIAQIISDRFSIDKLNVQHYSISQDDKIKALNMAKHSGQIGIGFHTVFLDEVDCGGKYNISNFSVENKSTDKDTDPMNAVHTDIEASFEILRSQIMAYAISMTVN